MATIVHVHEKNTFIEVTVPKETKKRSLSVPKTMWTGMSQTSMDSTVSSCSSGASPRSIASQSLSDGAQGSGAAEQSKSSVIGPIIASLGSVKGHVLLPESKCDQGGDSDCSCSTQKLDRFTSSSSASSEGEGYGLDASQLVAYVHRTYIANSNNEGLTMMWHGIPRKWSGKRFQEVLSEFADVCDVVYAYLPENYWQKTKMQGGKGNNKGYAFVHLSSSRRECDFARTVASIAQQLAREMYTTHASSQGVSKNLQQMITVARTRAVQGDIFVRVDGRLSTVPKLALRDHTRIQTEDTA
jgi:hypothetical protein